MSSRSRAARESRPVAVEDVALREAQRKVGELSISRHSPCPVGAQGARVAEALEVSEHLPDRFRPRPCINDRTRADRGGGNVETSALEPMSVGVVAR